MSKRKYLRWTGVGFLPGIPARDMSLDEAKSHGGYKALAKTAVYELADVEEDVSEDVEEGDSEQG